MCSEVKEKSIVCLTKPRNASECSKSGEILTVEPPIRDPLKYGRPLYKGHLLRHHAKTLVLFYLRDRDNLSTRDITFSPKVSMFAKEMCRRCFNAAAVT